MNSNSSYNPTNSTQLGNLDNLNTDNGYTIEEKHKSPEQVIIMIITIR